MKKRIWLAFTLALVLLMLPISVSGSVGDIDWYKLTAAQNYHVGTVRVEDKGDILQVMFHTIEPDEGCYLTETHLALAENLEGIPQTKNGRPIPGQFEYSHSFETPVRIDTYDIPMTLGDNTVIIAAHAVVECPGWEEDETAWGSKCGQCCDFDAPGWATWFRFPWSW